ncbi:MFS transporter [Domibacillus epiphyticus]|uniref:MFS transporter n=1 Tax=Domibacillus epiphyticus TaxID=1714355 RepID=A0A1V2A4U7_9BACI|nr:MFS transporter [Domibacillus epiphyticus]OMP65960.1 MFS transporter [Domibacillus epiphyticus]
MQKSRGWRVFLTLPVLSWALYDFANTIFSSNITTIFFPFYIQEAAGGNERLDQIASTFLSYANAVSSFFLVLFSPLFGVWIDRTGRKKRYVVSFALTAILFTALMGLIAPLRLGEFGGLPAAFTIVVVLFVAAKFFYQSSLIFYDAMLPDIATKDTISVLSGFGVAVGYLGTLVGLTVYPLVSGGNYADAFLPTAILFFIFTLPMMLAYKETPAAKLEKRPFFAGYRDVWETFKEMRSYRSIFLFMIVYFFINDAIATAIAMMAVYAKAIVGFTSSEFILLYLVSTVSSIIGSFIFGYITRAASAKKAVFYVGFILFSALLLGTFAVNRPMFWVTGSLFGAALGAVWVTSRVFIIELSPEDKRGQFFGLFAFSGKLSAIVGPLMYGTITLMLADYGDIASRIALASLMLFVLIGLLVHRKIPE